MNKLFIILCILIISVSCTKDNDEITTSAIVEQIINPPAPPEVYSNNSVEPKIIIRNTGTTDITSIAIRYNISINNVGGGYSIGPTTTWFGSIKPEENVEIILNKWESYGGSPPLMNGTHLMYVNINQINTDQYHDDNYNLVKRLFILESQIN